jgi:hypothetical protein
MNELKRNAIAYGVRIVVGVGIALTLKVVWSGTSTNTFTNLILGWSIAASAGIILQPLIGVLAGAKTWHEPELFTTSWWWTVLLIGVSGTHFLSGGWQVHWSQTIIFFLFALMISEQIIMEGIEWLGEKFQIEEIKNMVSAIMVMLTIALLTLVVGAIKTILFGY